MSLTRRSRRGFSLTEILMAVGILGIGLTMVASIFPVAVDQTRRANESTMAALCARSIAAMMRATRYDFIRVHRNYFRTLMTETVADKVNDRERPAEFGITLTTLPTDSKRNPGVSDGTANGIISRDMRVYNPNMFLYEAGRRYDVFAPGTFAAPPTGMPYWPMWNAGNYVPVIYVTPIVPVDKRVENDAATIPTAATGTYNHDAGPFRVTIVIFKSRGTELMHPRTKSWYQHAKLAPAVVGEPTFVAGAGDYVIDRTRHSGECYMIDFANIDSTKTVAAVAGSANYPPILLACGYSASGARFAFNSSTYPSLTATSATTTTGMWYPLPGAIAAFHTIIGD